MYCVFLCCILPYPFSPSYSSSPSLPSLQNTIDRIIARAKNIHSSKCLLHYTIDAILTSLTHHPLKLFNMNQISFVRQDRRQNVRRAQFFFFTLSTLSLFINSFPHPTQHPSCFLLSVPLLSLASFFQYPPLPLYSFSPPQFPLSLPLSWVLGQ